MAVSHKWRHKELLRNGPLRHGSLYPPCTALRVSAPRLGTYLYIIYSLYRPSCLGATSRRRRLIHIHTHSHIFIHIHTYSYIFIHIHTYSFIFIFIHIHSYSYIFSHIRSYSCKYKELRNEGAPQDKCKCMRSHFGLHVGSHRG